MRVFPKTPQLRAHVRSCGVQALTLGFRMGCNICSLSAQVALFRLIRIPGRSRYRSQKTHRSSPVSARIDESKPFQMKKITAQCTICYCWIDLSTDIGKLAFSPSSNSLEDLALAVREVMATRSGATYPLGRNRTPTVPPISRNSGSGCPAHKHRSAIFCVPHPQRSTSPRR